MGPRGHFFQNSPKGLKPVKTHKTDLEKTPLKTATKYDHFGTHFQSIIAFVLYWSVFDEIKICYRPHIEAVVAAPAPQYVHSKAQNSKFLKISVFF